MIKKSRGFQSTRATNTAPASAPENGRRRETRINFAILPIEFRRRAITIYNGKRSFVAILLPSWP
jgi:hypothetical protein